MEFKRINIQTGPVIDYMGMVFDCSKNGSVIISMQYTVEEMMLLIGVDDESKTNTPATTNLFDIHDSSPTLEVSE